jgi:hypothetical protein
MLNLEKSGRVWKYPGVPPPPDSGEEDEEDILPLSVPYDSAPLAGRSPLDMRLFSGSWGWKPGAGLPCRKPPRAPPSR